MIIRLFQNSLFLLCFCSIIGYFVGQIKIKHLKLGTGATLFIGLLISYILGQYKNILIEIPKVLFLTSLIGFISVVGIKASKNIEKIIKEYGFKFMVLAIIVTSSGGLITFLFIKLFGEIKLNIIGTYIGALTSSPGLATALEIAKDESQVAIGLGYSIAYIPGILVVILFTQICGKRHKIEKNIPKIRKIDKSNKINCEFSIISYLIIVLVGIIIGMIKVTFSASISFSLGLTGGVLISSLILGNSKKVLKTKFDENILDVIRDLALYVFLGTVGLNYGYKAISSIGTSGIILLGIGMIIGLASIFIGYLCGRYILKIELVYLAGGICGGMTSTPGLASAIDAFNSEKVVLGYGATYPFALISMILWTNFLFK